MEGKTQVPVKEGFFEEIFSMELRWLNIKIWSDKARRSRFFTDSKAEKSCVSVLKSYILQNPMVISRMESRGNLILKKDIIPQQMNQIFFRIEEQGKRDVSLFQYEYPPDMSVHKPGEWITHTWVMKNAGEIPWKNRRFECVSPPDWLNEESRTVKNERNRLSWGYGFTYGTFSCSKCSRALCSELENEEQGR